MKTRTRSKLVLAIAAAAALIVGIGAVRAAAHGAQRERPAVERIVPVATPVELNPCAMGAC